MALVDEKKLIGALKTSPACGSYVSAKAYREKDLPGNSWQVRLIVLHSYIAGCSLADLAIRGFANTSN